MTAKTRAELEAQFTDQPFGSGGRKQYRQVDNNDLKDLIDSVPLISEVSGAEQRIWLIEAIIDAEDVVPVDGSWNSPIVFPVPEGAWITECWIQILTEFNITGATYAVISFRTDDPGGADVVVPSGGLQALTGYIDSTVGGIQQAIGATLGPAESYNSWVGSHLDIDDGGGMKPRTLPARVNVACNLVANVVTDGSAGSTGQVKLYAQIMVPALP